MDRTDTAQIGIHRNNIFSLYFGTYEFLIPDVQSLDFDYLQDVLDKKPTIVQIKNIVFRITEDLITARFTGMELKKGVWITGKTTEEHTVTLEGIPKKEVYYMVYLLLHLFSGPEPVD